MITLISMVMHQLTVARIRCSQGVQFNAENGEERQEGIIPVIEDWHAKMCCMKVNSAGCQ